MLVISWKNVPGVHRAAQYVGKQAALASTSFASTRSETARQVVAHIGKGAGAVSSVAGNALDVIERSVEQVARRAGKVGAYSLGAVGGLVAGAAYALGLYSGLPMVALTALCAAGGYSAGYFGTKLAAMLTVTDKVEGVKGVADVVKEVCVTGDCAAPTPAPAAPQAEPRKDTPAA